MVRGWMLAVLASLVATAAASAEPAAVRFRWQTGQVMTYRVEQVTSAAEVVGENKVTTGTKLNNVKRWQVLAVDADGVATLQLSLTSLRIETTTPTGAVLVFDSANPDKSDAQLREQLAKYVGQPLATIRVSPTGQVVEVKESKHGPASRYEAELPFVVAVPNAAVQAGQSWKRSYAITLEPPHGTGEKFATVQQYECKANDGATATVRLTTQSQAQPEAPADRIPLLQMQPEGEAIIDLKLGCLKSARTTIEKELKDHQGEGSSYKFTSTYTEEYVGDK